MFGLFKTPNLFKNIEDIAKVAMFPPKHIRAHVTGESLEHCLRKLENDHGLPANDLYIFGKPYKVTSFPFGMGATKHSFTSKTSDFMKEEAERLNLPKKGYVFGHILEADKEVAGIRFAASIHISKNCPGIYNNGVCSNCGDTSH